MVKNTLPKTIRRSFALPRKLIDEAVTMSTKAEKANLNKLVTIALQEYIDNRKRREFETAMQAMGNDPEVLRECQGIERDFAQTEMDGLPRDK